MADIPIRAIIKFDVDANDIRKAARDVREAIEKVQADINVIVDPKNVQKELDKATSASSLNIHSIAISKEALDNAKNQADVALANVLMKVSLEDKSLARIKKQLEELSNISLLPGNAGTPANIGPTVRRFDALKTLAKLAEDTVSSLGTNSTTNISAIVRRFDALKTLAILSNKLITDANAAISNTRDVTSIGNVSGGINSSSPRISRPRPSEAVDKSRVSDEEFNRAQLARLNAEEDGSRATIRLDRERADRMRSLVKTISDREDEERQIVETAQQQKAAGVDINRGLVGIRRQIAELNSQLQAQLASGPFSSSALQRSAPVGFGGFGSQFGGNTPGLGGKQEANLPTKGEIDNIIEKVRKSANLTAEELDKFRKGVGSENLAEIGKLRSAEAVLTGITVEGASERKRMVESENAIRAAELRLSAATDKLTNSRLDASNALARARSGGGAGNPGQKSADFGGDLRTATAARERFVELLSKESNATDKAVVSLRAHNGIIGKSSALVSDLTNGLTAGQIAAVEFGKSAASAAQRFVAWAAPASFIFNALALLSQATSRIIDLDAAANQLVVSDIFGKTSEDIAKLGDISTLTAGRMQQIIDVSEQTGISLNKVGEALVEIERINRGQTGLDPGNFQEAVTALLQVEGAAISAVDSVRFLNSTLQQFNLTGADAVSVSAKLFEVSLESSFNVSQLANAVTRLGSAFTTLQNLRIDQVIGLVGTAASRTGSDVGRLSTALRQISTLAVANADKIEKLTGIQIAVDGGELKDFTTIVELLERINSLRGTTAQRDLISLIADRRNIADVAALAGAAKDLRKELGLTSTDEQLAAAASENVLKLRAVEIVKTQELTARFEKLNASIVDLVTSTGFKEFLGSVIDGSRRFVETLKDLSGVATSLLPLLKAVVAVRVAQFAGGFAKGFAEGGLGNQVQQQAVNQTASAVQEKRTLDAIASSVAAGLVPRRQALAIQNSFVNSLFKQAQIETQLEAAGAKLNANQKSYLANQLKFGELSAKEQQGIAEINNLRRQGLDISQKQISAQVALNTAITGGAEKQAAAGAKAKSSLTALFGGKGGIIATTGLVIGSFIADQITAANDESRAQLKKIDVVDEIFGGVLKGAALGGAAGSIFTGFGTAIGAAIGGGIGGVTAFANARKENEELSKQAEERLKTDKLAEQAFQRQLEIIREQRNARLRAGAEQDEATRNLLRLDTEIHQLELQINKAGAEKADQLGLTSKLQEKQTEQIRLQEQLAEREKRLTEERVTFEEDIVRIREKGSRILNAIALVEKSRVSLAQKLGNNVEAAEVQVKFNKDSVNSQIQAVQKEINRVTIEISKFNADSGRGQEARRAAKTKERLEQQVADIQLAGAQKEFDLRLSILDVSSREADTQIKAWESAATAVTNAFKEVIGAQISLVDAVGKSTSFLIEAANVTSDKIKAGLEATGVSGSRLQQKLAQQQTALATQQLNIFGSAAGEQIAILGSISTEGIQSLENRALNAADDFDALSLAVAALGSKVDKGTLLELSVAEANLIRSKAEIDARQSVIAQLTQIGQQEVGLIKNVISARQAELRSIIDRQKEQATLGQKLLETPEIIGKELRQVFTAQQFTAGLSGGVESQIQQLGDRIASLQRQKGGAGALQEVLAGLKAAQDLGIQVSNSFTPEKLTTAFSRLQFLAPRDVVPLITEEENTRTEIGRLQDGLVEKLNALADLQGQQRSLAETELALATRNQELVEKRASIQERATLLALQQQASANSTFIEVAANISRLGDLIVSETDVISALDFTSGDKAIEDQLKGLRPIFEELVNSNSEVKAERERRSKLEAEARKANSTPLGGREITDFIKQSTGQSGSDLFDQVTNRLSQEGINPSKRGPVQFEDDLNRILKEILIDTKASLLNDLQKLQTPGQALTVDNPKSKEALLQGERNNDLLGSIESEIARLNSLLGPHPFFSTNPDAQTTKQSNDIVDGLHFVEDAIKAQASEEQKRAEALIEELKNGQKRNEEAIERLKSSGFGNPDSPRPPPKGGRPPPKGNGDFGENTPIGNSIATVIDSATNRLTAAADRLATSQVGVNFGDLEIKIAASIVQQIEDGGFAAALKEALTGTELESQIATIQTAVIDVITQLGGTNPPLIIKTEAIDNLTGEEDNAR